MYAFFSRSNFVTRHYNIKPKKKNIFEINTSNMVRSGDLGKSAEVFHAPWVQLSFQMFRW